MKEAENTVDEAERLTVLDELSVVYSPSETRFDNITQMACKTFDVPTALISLVAKDRQWFKSAQGLDAAETPRRISFCGHAIQQADTFIVEDATKHPWFADNPLVLDAPHVRFYAGQPLEVHGRRVGTLCLLDQKPRQLSAGQIKKLKILAHAVEEELLLSGLSKGQQELLRELDESERSALIDPKTRIWNREGVEQVLLRELPIAAYEDRALVVIMFEIGVEGVPRIAELAGRLRQALSPTDVLGRYSENTLLLAFEFSDEEARASKGRELMASLTDQPLATGVSESFVAVRAASMTAYSPARLSVANLIMLTEKALAQVRSEPSGSILFFDRRQSPREE